MLHTYDKVLVLHDGQLTGKFSGILKKHELGQRPDTETTILPANDEQFSIESKSHKQAALGSDTAPLPSLA